MKQPTYCPHCAAILSTAVRGGFERLVCSHKECGYVHWDNPRPVVAAVLEYQGDMILVRNVGWPEKWFGLVTGFLEQGERPMDAIVREIKEELDLDAEVVELIGLYPFEQMNELIIAYFARATGKLSLNEELEDFKRIAPEKLRPWPFGTGMAVRDWISKRRKSD